MIRCAPDPVLSHACVDMKSFQRFATIALNIVANFDLWRRFACWQCKLPPHRLCSFQSKFVTRFIHHSFDSVNVVQWWAWARRRAQMHSKCAWYGAYASVASCAITCWMHNSSGRPDAAASSGSLGWRSAMTMYRCGWHTAVIPITFVHAHPLRLNSCVALVCAKAERCCRWSC